MANQRQLYFILVISTFFIYNVNGNFRENLKKECKRLINEGDEIIKNLPNEDDLDYETLYEKYLNKELKYELKLMKMWINELDQTINEPFKQARIKICLTKLKEKFIKLLSQAKREITVTTIPTTTTTSTLEPKDRSCDLYDKKCKDKTAICKIIDDKTLQAICICPKKYILANLDDTCEECDGQKYCNGHGTCKWSRDSEQEKSIEFCFCEEGWSGRHCENDHT